MPIPTEKSIRNPLLIELLRAGGPVKPADIYDRVAAHFPELSAEDRELELDCGHNKFHNRVQWVRQSLVTDGLLDGSVRGRWALTTKGTAAAQALSAPATAPKSPTMEFPSLLQLVEQHDSALRQQLRARIDKVPPFQFEHLSARLLRALGFHDVEVTQRSRDGGIDGHGRLKMGIVSINAAFQCKRWAGAVRRPDVDAFRGATQGKFDQAIFLTTSRFTDEARAESIRPGCIPVVMVDGSAVIDLMITHSIGVATQPLVLPQLDEEFFAEIEEEAE